MWYWCWWCCCEGSRGRWREAESGEWRAEEGGERLWGWRGSEGGPDMGGPMPLLMPCEEVWVL